MKRRNILITAAVLASLAFFVIVFSDEIRYLPNSITANAICFPDSSKDKISFIIAENGVYDNEQIRLQVSRYFDSVKKDLNIDNAGIKKFPGKTIDELDEFVDGLYLNDDVGYIILLGDDLPISTYNEVISYTRLPRFGDTEVIDIETNTTIPTTNPDDTGICLVNDSKSGKIVRLITSLDACGPPAKSMGLDGDVDEKISCVNGDCRVLTEPCTGGGCTIGTTGGYWRCRDVAVSYIMPPVLYSESEKVDFVLKILSTYTDYHNSFNTIITKYQKSVLAIGGIGPVGEGEPMIGYNLPAVAVAYTDGEKISSELKSKHLVLFLGVHGSPDTILFDIGVPNQVSVSLDEYTSFSNEYGTPVLFVDAGQCGAFVLGYENSRHCCWPQIFMESGTWAYYGTSPGHGMKAKFTDEKTMGLAVRKSNVEQVFIFGDILAHMR